MNNDNQYTQYEKIVDDLLQEKYNTRVGKIDFTPATGKRVQILDFGGVTDVGKRLWGNIKLEGETPRLVRIEVHVAGKSGYFSYYPESETFNFI